MREIETKFQGDRQLIMKKYIKVFTLLTAAAICVSICSGCNRTVVEHQFHIDTEYTTEIVEQEVAGALGQLESQLKEMGIKLISSINFDMDNPEDKFSFEISETNTIESLYQQLMNYDKSGVIAIYKPYRIEDGTYGLMQSYLDCISMLEIVIQKPDVQGKIEEMNVQQLSLAAGCYLYENQYFVGVGGEFE